MIDKNKDSPITLVLNSLINYVVPAGIRNQNLWHTLLLLMKAGMDLRSRISSEKYVHLVKKDDFDLQSPDGGLSDLEDI